MHDQKPPAMPPQTTRGGADHLLCYNRKYRSKYHCWKVTNCIYSTIVLKYNSEVICMSIYNFRLHHHISEENIVAYVLFYYTDLLCRCKNP